MLSAETSPTAGCRTGWLGTGDAPLGQADVWADFAQRYRKQLEQTISIQVPHHGAAPEKGPVFFNPHLLPVSGMNAVLAAGTKNAYGHPEESVKTAIKKAGGRLQLVNELKRPGFEERLAYMS
jgi:beta-lactamase superfamily II metal-dependent hydrolase